MTEPRTPYYWWEKWRDGGGLPSERPKYLPRKIPKVWWVRYALHRKLLKATPAPALSLQQPRFWSKNGVWVTTSEAVVRQFPGIDPESYWVARQLNDLIWMVDSDKALIGQIESDGQASSLYSFMRTHPEQGLLPKAVVTTLNASPSALDHFANTGWDCLVECYVPENPNATWPKMAYEASKYWTDPRRVFPVYGVFHDYPLSNYQPLKGDGYSVWAAEYMTDEDWELFLNG